MTKSKKFFIKDELVRGKNTLKLNFRNEKTNLSEDNTNKLLEINKLIRN